VKRKNYILGIIHGLFFNSGLAASNSDTVLPIFLSLYFSSKTLVGLFSSFMRLGNIVPQLFTANVLEYRQRKKPVLIVVITLRFFCFLSMALLTFFFGTNKPFMAVVIPLLLLTYSLGGGVASIPFYDIIAKAIPSKYRGTFFAQRLFWGNLGGMAMGFLVRFILSGRVAFPQSYGLLFLTTAIFIGIAYLALGNISEPEEKITQEKRSFKNFIKDASKTMKEDVLLRTSIITEIISGSLYLSFPFLSIYARDVIGMKIGVIGYFISLYMLGAILSNLLWGFVSRKKGNGAVIFLSSLLPFLSILLFIINPLLLSVSFFFVGCYRSGRIVGFANFNLDIAKKGKRPLYISLRGTLISVMWLSPILGGYIVDIFSYKTLFLITLFSTFTGILLSTFLLRQIKGRQSRRR